MDNINGDLLSDFNGRLMPPYAAYSNRNDIIRWTSKVVDVLQDPLRLLLERPLPFNVSLTWRPEVHFWCTERGGVRRNNTGLGDLTLR